MVNRAFQMFLVVVGLLLVIILVPSLWAAGWNGSESIEYNPDHHDFLNQALFGRAYGTTDGTIHGINASQVMWFYNGKTTERIGFFGEPNATVGSPSHASENGLEESGSEPTLENIDIFHDHIQSPKISSNGKIAGWSTRFYGNNVEGKSVWLYDAPSHAIQRIGFYAGHEPDGFPLGYYHAEQTTGREKSEVTGVNPSGQTIGFSWYFNGDNYAGNTGWVHSGSTTTRIGLFDHPDCTTLQDSDTPLFINADGDVAGNAACGAWIYNGFNTERIGFYDNDGRPYDTIYHPGAEVWGINSQGQVMGYSYQKSNNAPNNYVGGKTAWLYTGINTVPIGLYSSEYVNWFEDRRFTTNVPLCMNDSGHVAGKVLRWNPAPDYTTNGMAAWQYNGVTTTRIGIFGDPYASTDVFTHTSSTGEEKSEPEAICNGGQSIGFSLRYKQAATHGYSAWYYNGTSNQRIGFFDGSDPLAGQSVKHTRNDGYEYSRAVAINGSGAVIGKSYRYQGSVGRGRSGWYYDPVAGTATILVFSQDINGNAVTEPQILTQSGEVYGVYAMYSGSIFQGWRLFYWTPQGGFRDVSQEAGGILMQGNWNSSIATSVVNVDDAGNIIGDGRWYPPGLTYAFLTPFVVKGSGNSAVKGVLPSLYMLLLGVQ